MFIRDNKLTGGFVVTSGRVRATVVVGVVVDIAVVAIGNPTMAE
jgi:hypothetical protein